MLLHLQGSPASGAQPQNLESLLRSLVKAELLKTSEEESAFGPETVFSLNMAYSK